MRPPRPAFTSLLIRAGLSGLGLATVLALSACGHADSANEAASADNVEIPAEEAMSGLPPAAAPVADNGPAAADSAVSGQ
jgi:hypothetical protein